MRNGKSDTELHKVQDKPLSCDTFHGVPALMVLAPDRKPTTDQNNNSIKAQLGEAISYFPHCYNNMPGKNSLRKSGFVLVHSLRV